MGMAEAKVEWFYQRVDQSDLSGCWLWTGGINNRGYGTMSFNGKSMLVHRFSYLMTNGEIPDGLFILHSCDNPLCIHPGHLHAGTQKQNQQEMQSRGRCYVGFGSGLTADAVRDIRQNHPLGIPIDTLAKKYNVSARAVRKVVRGDSWKDVDDRYKSVSKGELWQSGPSHPNRKSAGHAGLDDSLRIIVAS